MPDIWVEMTFRSYITEIECVGQIDKKYLLPLIRSPFLDIARDRCCGGGCIICIPTVTVWEVSHFKKIKKTELLKSYNQDIIDLFMPLIEEKLKNYGEIDAASDNDAITDASDNDAITDASDNDAITDASDNDAITDASDNSEESTDCEDESDDLQEDDIDNYQNNSDEDVNIDQDAESYSETNEEYADSLPNEYIYYKASNMDYNTESSGAEDTEWCEPCDNNLKRKNNNESNVISLNKKTKLD